jgi:putative tryptophan/tyrosine transport system substrate-binding protein
VNNRRKLFVALGAGALTAPFGVFAQQQTGKVYRIGYLGQGYPPDRSESGAREGFLQGLRKLGYVEGRNLIIEYRWAELNFNRLPALAAELVQLKVDVIAAQATLAAAAAKRATSTIPIVMTVSLHAVESGLVTSLAHPGGNITGVTGMADETIVKRLELLKEMQPKHSRVAVLWNPAFYKKQSEPQWRAIEIAAPKVAVTLQSVEVRASNDFERAFASMTREHASVVLVFPDPLTIRYREQIAQLALRHRLPTGYQDQESVEAGGLMSYGSSFFESGRLAATYVDKILKGAKPADLPVEQPTKFELVVNLKTAKALGIKIPNSILVRADRVIE